MRCDFCQEGVFCDLCIAWNYPGHIEFVDNSPSHSPLQQHHPLPWASVNSGGNFPSAVPHYHPTHGGGTTGDDHVPAPAHLNDTGSDLTPSFLENSQHENYIATGQPLHNHVHSPFSDNSPANDLGFPGNASESNPNEGHPHAESHASGRLVCKWRGDHGLCGKTVNGKEFAKHMASLHLPPPGRTLVMCRWDGCQLEESIRRDTIIRHIRQIDCGVRPRRQS